jgi:hypothetical protein
VKFRSKEAQQVPDACVLLANEFVQVRILAEARVICVVRSALRAERLRDIDESWGGVERALTSVLRREHGLLIDMREARGRNDPEFEAAVARYRARTIEGFRSVAVVVRSIPGQMQIQRHVNEDKLSRVHVFDDVHRALAFLRSP